ncbi:Uncharacterised protein [Shigella sonnei]|nr:Uncharacterised protein [Shigella sonnei]
MQPHPPFDFCFVRIHTSERVIFTVNLREGYLPRHRLCCQRCQSNFISTAFNIVSHIQTADTLFDFFNQFFVVHLCLRFPDVTQINATMPTSATSAKLSSISNLFNGNCLCLQFCYALF